MQLDSLISTFQGSGYLQAQSFSSPDSKPSITLPHTCSGPPPRHPPSLCLVHPQISVSPTRKCLSSSPRNSPLPQDTHTSPGASNMGCRSCAISLAIRAASTAFSATLLAATAFRRASAALLGPRDRDLSDFPQHHFVHALMLQPLPFPTTSHLPDLSYLWSPHVSAQSRLRAGTAPRLVSRLSPGLYTCHHTLSSHALPPLGPVVTLHSSSCRASSPPRSSVIHCWTAPT